MSNELKDCPFCGGKPDYMMWKGNDNAVWCKDCNTGTAWVQTKDEAANIWNRRAAPSVASGAQGELPPLPKPFFYYEANADESVEWSEACVCIDDVYTNAGYAAENGTHGGRAYSEAQMQAYARAAIANSAPNAALVEALKACAEFLYDIGFEGSDECQAARTALTAAGVEMK